MTYPTIEQVNAADREQICCWHRFLSSPGMRAIDGTKEEFKKAMEEDAVVMDRIVERLHELGGFTPEISKRLGWEMPP